jgi:hypothetical protein
LVAKAAGLLRIVLFKTILGNSNFLSVMPKFKSFTACAWICAFRSDLFGADGDKVGVRAANERRNLIVPKYQLD